MTEAEELADIIIAGLKAAEVFGGQPLVSGERDDCLIDDTFNMVAVAQHVLDNWRPK